jgi:pimeloyl-ACP methyl ester carboxylesterase
MKWLLLRGLTRDQRHWGRFRELFAAALGGEVQGIDPPGFGTQHARRSPSTIEAITDDIRDRFTDVRGDGEWSILGISLGGMVTLDWISRYRSDFVGAVVINSSTADTVPFADRFSRHATQTILGVLARRELGKPERLERAILGLSSNLPADQLDPIALQWAAWNRECPPSRASVLAQVKAGLGFKLPSDITTPVLVLTSAQDRLVSHRSSKAIAARLGAPIHVHTTAGHDLATDDPDWITAQVREWLSTSSAVRASSTLFEDRRRPH